MSVLLVPPRQGGSVPLAWVTVLLFLVASYGCFALARSLTTLETKAAEITRCTSDAADTKKRLRQMTRDRDLAVWRASEFERLMRSSAGQATDEAFKRLRIEDQNRALRAEVERLKVSAATLPAAPISTASITTAPEPSAKRRPRRHTSNRQHFASRQDQPHHWFKWAEPRP